MIEILASNIFV